MATKISELIAASTPLAGTEQVWVEQGGVPRKVAVSEIGALGLTEIGGVDFYDTAGSGGGDFRLLHPDNSASLSIDTSNQTGAIKITLPYSWTNSMLQMVVKGYNYKSSGGGAFLLNLGGYNYSTNGWTNTSAEVLGELTNPKVRFGHDGTNCCIVIGDVTDDWDYPKVWVEQLAVTFAGMNPGWHTGWNVSVISSEAGITYTATHYPDDHIFREVTVDSLFARNGSVIKIGGNTSNQNLRVRHLEGKEAATGNKDRLYLNYNTELGATLGGDLNIAGVAPKLAFTDSDDNDGYIQHQSGSMQFWNNGTRTCYMNSGNLFMENGYLSIANDQTIRSWSNNGFIKLHNSGDLDMDIAHQHGVNVFIDFNNNSTNADFTVWKDGDDEDTATKVWSVDEAGKVDMTGQLSLSGTLMETAAGNRLNVLTSYGNVSLGPSNVSYCHFYTDRPKFYFSKPMNVNGAISVHSTNVEMSSTGFVSDSSATAYRFGSGKGYIGVYNDGFRINASNGAYMIYGSQGGAVLIRYNNSNKFATASGGATTTGTHTATDFNSTSSERWKENIAPLHSALNSFMGLLPVTFDWRDDYEGWNRAQGKNSVGLVVEHVAKAIPMAAIKELDGDGNWNGNYSGVDYGKIAPYHIAVTQDHEVRLRELERKLEAA